MFVKALPDRVTAGGVEFEIMTKGEGKPVLFLHGVLGVDADDPLVARLAKSHKVIAASHPGFGLSSRPDHVTTIDDVVYAYLDLVEALDLRDVALVGASLGGWIAAELAVRGSNRFSSLVLIDAVGAKFGDREKREIYDIFGLANDEMPGVLFSTREAGLDAMHGLRFPELPEEASVRYARNRETITLFGWSPTLHNPKLRHRLARVKLPTLVLWGDQDHVVGVDYGRAYAGAIAGAKFEVVSGVGHCGTFENPDEFAKRTLAFLSAGRAR
ncbi:alpha/beta fold hydrolase [Terricaulis silvestris]|uniref:Arylesterase n=1 Tax=Terricaulis silvestris TaxID=2686094 RepID=A0A6I6MKC7_9CAUL|nr:alpha/beta hydrolase [Terricaulis silvestris]QGZ93668.1 Arylesterase [Terricaulis silvestris]